MPKYYEFKVCGYYLYYTASCVIEAMHVHASDRKLTEAGSAKFFVKSNGDTTVEKQGVLTDREVRQGMDDAVTTVMLQCELWTDNNDMEQHVVSYIEKFNSDPQNLQMVAEEVTPYGTIKED